MISRTGRKVYNSSVVKKVIKYGVDEIMSENRNERKAINKIERQNSAEYKAAQRGRNIAQQMTGTRDEIIDGLRDLAKSIANEIIANFSSEFEVLGKSKKANNYTQPQISNGQFEEFIADYLPILKRLQTMCYNEEIAPVIDRYLNTYEAMFKKLIDLDVRFALYAPQKTLQYNEIQHRIQNVEGELQEKIDEYVNRVENDKDYVIDAEVVEENSDSRRKIAERMINDIREKEFHSHIRMISSVENATTDLYVFIINQLKLQDGSKKTIKFEDIKNVFLLGDAALKSIKKYSASDALNKYSGWDECDPYTELFKNLMNVNMRFAFFAPKSSLNRMDIDFDSLSDKEKTVMLKILIDNGLWNDEEFYENYKESFIAIKKDDLIV